MLTLCALHFECISDLLVIIELVAVLSDDCQQLDYVLVGVSLDVRIRSLDLGVVSIFTKVQVEPICIMGSSVLQGLVYLLVLRRGFVRVANSHALATCTRCYATLFLSSYVLTICATISQLRGSFTYVPEVDCYSYVQYFLPYALTVATQIFYLHTCYLEQLHRSFTCGLVNFGSYVDLLPTRYHLVQYVHL